MAQNWYYARGNQQFGPVTLDQLIGLLGTGQVQHADLVWCEGMAQWSPASTVPELAQRPVPAPIVSAPATAAPVAANPYAANTPFQQPFPPTNAPFGAGYQNSPATTPPWPGQTMAPGMLNYQAPYGGEVNAGFWLRFVAWIIDMIICFVLGAIIGGIIGGIAGASGIRPGSSDWEGVAVFIQLISAAAQWLYFALLESSSTQASLGKLALGLKVTDLNGARIGFGKATGRYFGKIISGIILCIGFFMAGWTERKQALHDVMAGTLVVKKNP